MYRFVEKPNLPEGRVRMVLAGDIYLEDLRLDRLGICAVGLKPSCDLDAPVAAHTDMQVTHLYREKILSDPDGICKVNSLYISNTEGLSCKVRKLVENDLLAMTGETKLTQNYPKCAAYNVLLLGKLAVYNPKCIDSALKRELEALQYQPVHVNQGFARCSVCVVDQNAVITADTGIAKALTACGIDVLRITPGYIDLPGYDTGFIGGASFKVSKNVLAFSGYLNRHPDQDRICDFLKAHHTEPIYLSDKQIFDIGTAIPLIEEV